MPSVLGSVGCPDVGHESAFQAMGSQKVSVPATWSNVPDWMRMVARDLNPLVQGYPYMQLDSEPTDVEEGFTFYDTTAHVGKTWDGTSWRSHW